MYNNELARKLFVSLVKDPFYKYSGHYLVLCDQNYIADFWADSDDAAIVIFESGEYKK